MLLLTILMRKEEIFYTKDDLVSFGNYCLSEERAAMFDLLPAPDSPPAEDRRKFVNDVDFDHWSPNIKTETTT